MNKEKQKVIDLITDNDNPGYCLSCGFSPLNSGSFCSENCENEIVNQWKSKQWVTQRGETSIRYM